MGQSCILQKYHRLRFLRREKGPSNSRLLLQTALRLRLQKRSLPKSFPGIKSSRFSKGRSGRTAGKCPCVSKTAQRTPDGCRTRQECPGPLRCSPGSACRLLAPRRWLRLPAAEAATTGRTGWCRTRFNASSGKGRSKWQRYYSKDEVHQGN